MREWYTKVEDLVVMNRGDSYFLVFTKYVIVK